MVYSCLTIANALRTEYTLMQLALQASCLVPQRKEVSIEEIHTRIPSAFVKYLFAGEAAGVDERENSQDNGHAETASQLEEEDEDNSLPEHSDSESEGDGDDDVSPRFFISSVSFLRSSPVQFLIHEGQGLA